MCLLLFAFGVSQFPPLLQKKVNNAVKTTYGSETFSLIGVKVPEEINKSLKDGLEGDQLFKVMDKEALLGYIYVGEAPSMKKVFDYVIMFNPDLSIKKSKVLIYREEYGLQIGNQRWLQQFVGLTVNDSAVYGENIDAISGATISATSMTKATDQVLKALKKLKKAAIL
jgi:Na+-translocating ferredoxin:NAD+ oxidoreductase RnfG subunit